MKRTIILPFAGLMFLMATGCNKPVSVLIVAGGHGFDTVEFYEAFRSLDGISFDSVLYPEAMDILGSREVDPYDVLVFYDFVPGMDPGDSVVFQELTADGKPMLFLHHALGTFQQWDRYREIVGGRYVMPGFETDSSLLSDFKHDIDLQVEVTDPDHPITRGVEDFEIHDEGYSNIQVMPGIHPLLRTSHPDCAPLVGWTNRYSASNIAYLMLGHDRHAYENESFRLLVSNSIKWLAAND
jgi:hypothetical protein